MEALIEPVIEKPAAAPDDPLYHFVKSDPFIQRFNYYNQRGVNELVPALLDLIKEYPADARVSEANQHARMYRRISRTPEVTYLLKNKFSEVYQPDPGLNSGVVLQTTDLKRFVETHREPKHLPLYWLLVAGMAIETPIYCRWPGMSVVTPYDPVYGLQHMYYLATVRSGIEPLDAQIPNSFEELDPEFITEYSQAAQKYQTEITCERMRSPREHTGLYDTWITQAYHVARTNGFRDKERILYGPAAMRYFRPENNLSSAISFLFNRPADQEVALHNDPQDPAISFKFFKCLAPALMPYDNMTLHSTDLGRAILERYLRIGSNRRPEHYDHPLHPYRAGNSTSHVDLLYRFATYKPEFDGDYSDNMRTVWALIPGTKFLGTSRLVIVPQPAWQTFYPFFWRDQILNNPDARLLHCLAIGDGTHFHDPNQLIASSPILSALNRPTPEPRKTFSFSKTSAQNYADSKPRTVLTIDATNTEWVKHGNDEICVYTGPRIHFPEDDVDVHIQVPHVNIPGEIVTQGDLIFDTPFACDVYTHRVQVSAILQEEKPEKGQKHTLSASHDIIVACSLQALDLVISSLQNVEVDGDLWCAFIRADGNIRVSEHLMAVEIHSGGCVEANKITAREIIAADRVFSRTETRAEMVRSLECFAARGLRVPDFQDPAGAISKGVDAVLTIG